MDLRGYCLQAERLTIQGYGEALAVLDQGEEFPLCQLEGREELFERT